MIAKLSIGRPVDGRTGNLWILLHIVENLFRLMQDEFIWVLLVFQGFEVTIFDISFNLV